MIDLAEATILPILWVALAIAVITILFTGIKRVLVETDEDEYPRKALRFDMNRLRLAGVVAVLGVLGLSSLVVVPPGHRGVIFTQSGIVETERLEGYSFIFPLVHRAHMVNVREQKYENLEVFAQTSDGLEVTTQVGVNYHVQPDRAAQLLRDVGLNYEEAIIAPAVLGLVKREIGRVVAIDLFFNRGEVERSIHESLIARLGQRDINVTFVALQDTIFDSQFVNAVLDTESARLEAIAEERREDKAQSIGRQSFLQAQGEANAILELSQAEATARARLEMTPAQYVWYRIWNGELPDTWVSGENDLILDLP